MVPLTRRALLAGASAGALTAALPGGVLGAEAPVAVLRSGLGRAHLEGSGRPAADLWLFNGRSPGPLLRLTRGVSQTVRVINDLAEPTTVHWHGLRIDNAMDGVPGLTQEPIPPGGTFDYTLTPPDSGSFWYHSHYKGAVQMDRGLYGPLIVEDDSPLDVDLDHMVVLDDWRLTEQGALDQRGYGDVRERAHGGRYGNVLTINGREQETLPVPADGWVRLRLLNAANARVLPLTLTGANAWVAAKDGLTTRLVGLDPNPLLLAPAQRVDLLIRTAAPGTTVALSFVSPQETLALLTLEIGDTVAPERTPTLTPAALPEPDRTDPFRVPLPMEGGAMGGLEGARHKGVRKPLRELAREHGLVWALAGDAGMPEKPLFTVARGRTVELGMANLTGWDHAMHVHGHHLRVVEWSQRPPQVGGWHDTVLMRPRENVIAAFVADNPGKWLLHCHMMEHHAGGMVTWFEVT
ncbi:MAG: multicopper oxidase family protein [Alphaproteobacteria bacterium]|nr:multicopper oxidase family protein [Alphaproteobacteria bacterium]